MAHPTTNKPLPRTNPDQTMTFPPTQPAAEDFRALAQIPNWGTIKLTTPQKLHSYNDDLIIESYVTSKYHLAGMQRSGIFESIIDAKNYEEHMTKACQTEFFLAKDTKLPSDLDNALNFHAKATPTEIRSFWAHQTARITSLSQAAQKTQSEWDKLIPTEISYSAKGIRTAALSHLLSSQNMGGQRWIAQFTFGFPIVGTLSQKGVFPPSEKVLPTPISPEELWVDAKARFAERSTRSSKRDNLALWNEAIEQVKTGWLEKHQVISNTGRLANEPDTPLNLAFRFGVQQPDKVRAVDDLRHARTNTACQIATPNTLPTWDHIAQLALTGAAYQTNWSFFKEDHASAYKWLPLQPDHARYAAVALQSPVDGNWYSFTPRALMFGSVASVLHYTCLSRIIASLACRLLGIPMVGYIDDFGALCRTELLAEARVAFRILCNAIGVELKSSKADAGNSITFLGLKGTFPSTANIGQLLVSLPPEKAEKWAKLIDAVVSTGSINHSTLEKLIGKISFSQTAIFGKFARTMISPLHHKLHAKSYRERISIQEKRVFQWWAATLRSLKPRIATPKPKFPELIIYTDAATRTNTICAVLFDPIAFATNKSLIIIQSDTVPIEWHRAFGSTNLIEGLEMLALVSFVVEHGPQLAGRSVAAYVDNNCALTALIKGSAKSEVLNNLVQLFWYYVQKFDIKIWLERVPSTRNVADLPTRNKLIPFKAGITRKFTKLMELFQELKTKMSQTQHERDLILGNKWSSKLLMNVPHPKVRSYPYKRTQCSASGHPKRPIAQQAVTTKTRGIPPTQY